MEIVVGDLIRELGVGVNQVLNMGFYEANRLWLIFDELKARDLHALSRVIDASQADEDYRQGVFEWLENRQPRQFQKNLVPQAVLDKFKLDWDNA